MDLERAMALVAGYLAIPETDQVRTAMLQVVSGHHVPGLPARESMAIQRWYGQQYGSEADPPGALYQEMLSRVVEPAKDGTLRVRRERGAHRATGAYYTQDLVVQYMVRMSLTYLPDAHRVIDPACGSGAFLAGFRNAAPGQGASLTGLDADSLALEMCRRNVPEADLRNVDALFSEVESGYDLCLGNPPYISSGLRGVAAHDSERQARFKARFPHTAQYKINTYPLFVERGLELLRDGGVLGYILPDSFLSGRYFEGMRRMLLAHTLLEITLIQEDFWAHGRVGQSVILFVRKGAAPPGHQTTMKVCQRVSDLWDAPTVALPPTELPWGPVARFPLLIRADERRLVQTMELAAGGRRLGHLLRSYSGLIARHGQKSLLRSTNPGGVGPWGRLLRSGREIDRYRLDWAGEEVCLDPAFIKSGGVLAYYRQPKILLRQTAESLRAVYDADGFFCLNNVHLLVPRQADAPLRALLGLINSGPVDRLYRAITMETGRVYPQVDLDLLEALPVPQIAPEAAARLESLVVARESATPSEVAQVEAEIDLTVARLYQLD